MAARMLLPLLWPRPCPLSSLAHTIIYLLLLLLLAPSLSSPPSLPFAAVLRLLNVTLRICQRASPKPVAAQCHHLHALPAPAFCSSLYPVIFSGAIWHPSGMPAWPWRCALLCSVLPKHNGTCRVSEISLAACTAMPPPSFLLPPSPCLSSLFRSSVFCSCLACYFCYCCCFCCLVAFGFVWFRFCFLAFSLLCVLTLSCIFLVA